MPVGARGCFARQSRSEHVRDHKLCTVVIHHSDHTTNGDEGHRHPLPPMRALGSTPCGCKARGKVDEIHVL